MMDAGLKLAPIFGDGMILQRDAVNKIYGEETVADTVMVSFMGNEYHSLVNKNHEFCVKLPPVDAGGPYTITVKGSGGIVLSDIYFGDVYLLSGQSNMEQQIKNVLDVSEEEISKTSEPLIRQYYIPATFNFSKPEKYMCPAEWKKAEGTDLLDFSAAGYFFAKEIRDSYQIPVGLIMSAVGGSSIESWMNPVTLRRFGDYEEIVEKFKDIDYFNNYTQGQNEAAQRWSDALRAEEMKYDFSQSFQDWDTCTVPSMVSDYGKGTFSGSVYLCREINLDSEPVGNDAVIYLGSMIDSDEIFINGTLVGRTDFRYPIRKFKLPEGILKKGRNLITVHLVINNNNGGTMKEKPYYLFYNGHRINLEGVWYYKIGKKAEEPMPFVLFPPTLPICFYHTVVVPISKMAVKGLLWYQGETNCWEPKNYSEKFIAMVSEWRNLFGWEVPVIFVQLANYREPMNTEDITGWCQLREEQRRCLSLSQVAMTVTLDIGESYDIHPQNKKELGIRLSKAAKYLIYHENIIHSGPLPISAIQSGHSAVIRFEYLGNTKLESSLSNFELAGEDGIYHSAAALRKDDMVTVSCKEVTVPVSVRYAWLDNPRGIDFYNEADLPAASFCVDVTEGDEITMK